MLMLTTVTLKKLQFKALRLRGSVSINNSYKMKKTYLFFYCFIFLFLQFDLFAQQKTKYIQFGIGSGFVPRIFSLENWDISYNTRLKISQGLDIYGSYLHYFSNEESVEMGVLASFDRVDASIYKREKPREIYSMDLIMGDDAINVITPYLGYGRDFRLDDKNAIKIGVKLGFPIFINNRELTNNYNYLDSEITNSESTLLREYGKFNLTINPYVSCKKKIGKKGNIVSVYFGYSQVINNSFNGEIEIQRQGEGRGVTWRKLFYNSFDFGLSYSIYLE